MFYSMVDKCIMTQWQKFSIFWQQLMSCGNIHRSYQHYQPGKITLQVSVLMIEYLVATSYECAIFCGFNDCCSGNCY